MKSHFKELDMTYCIVSDSSSDLRSSVLQDNHLFYESVPMRLTIGAQDWADDENLSVPLLLDTMQNSKAASTSACPSPAAFARAFEKADCSVCFTISSNLSGAYNSAMLGRDMALEEHPEKKICVIDSRSTAGVLVLLVRKAERLLSAENADFDTVCDTLRSYQASLRTLFTLECFDNLIKNGRMRPLVGNLLHSLGIHIIADATPQGTIHVSGKARGEIKAYQLIVELMRASKDCTNAEVVITNCENLSGAMKLRDLIQKELPVKDVTILPCRGLTSFYAMKNGLILGY
jgi:DegV family protein with EDD domain